MSLSIVLASASPRRKELLSLLVDSFEVRTSFVDETPFLKNASPASVERAALAKAEDVAAGLDRERLVIAADTVIFFHNRLLGKPRDEKDAAAMLMRLRGEVHSVITGMAVLSLTSRFLFHEETRVWMKKCSDRKIMEYIATGEPLDKAGAYAIQGVGGKLIQSIRGCYPNVIGLPLCALARRLIQAGVAIRAVQEVCPAKSLAGSPGAESALFREAVVP